VMATGIISTAAHLLSIQWLARVLLVLNVVFFSALWLLTLVRLVRWFPRLRNDLAGHSTGPGFFTLVAGTCVLGTEVALVQQDFGSALVLWLLGLTLWIVLTYAFFTAVITRGTKPALASGIHGGWMVSVVATQSVSVLATVLAAGRPELAEGLLFTSLCFCLAGGVLYVVLITLLFHRLLFHSLAPEELSPLFWISMGAAAITTLAAARLLASRGEWGLLRGLESFLAGYALLFWSTATWWIPLLMALGAWRHVVRRFPLRYEPQYWSMVFPLGMYTACTVVLAQSVGLSFLEWIPKVSLWVALATWIAVFIGMAAEIIRFAGNRKS
jgi:tellurite resistance protein TehA-like permease